MFDIFRHIVYNSKKRIKSLKTFEDLGVKTLRDVKLYLLNNERR